ncbi:MAG: polyribonucleotide nucleotidyltransferase [Candidatus Levybacteria bacterium]|nr:polyribonucleotide nucleotidyltransferase [Candidatus Levybacteria bacterium]
MEKTSVSFEFAGKTLTLETGQLAKQATSSILARLGDTMVLATVVQGGTREDLGYFPLNIEYVERLYAGGKIKGSRWVKREGRPSDDAVLIGRLIDRSIRPLFPKEYKNEVQVIVTVLSVDSENDPDILSIIAVSAALAISPISWKGPVGAIRIGYMKDPENGKGEFLLNPTTSESGLSDLDLVVSQAKDLTLMIEAGAKQVPEEIVHEAMKHAHDETKKVINFIDDLAKKIGAKKTEVTPSAAYAEMVAIVEKSYKQEIVKLAASLANKESGGSEMSELITMIFDQEKMKDPTQELDKKIIAKAVESIMYKNIRHDVVKSKKRVDGRAVDEIRPLSVQVGVLPRTHGSAIFQRGLTQALTVATLGSPRLEQLIESAEGEETKRYMHHYSMPPYSVGETGRLFGPSRREIGHGALAERALLPIIPSKDKFPYTIRVVSEILSSNGSTSMAATCGSTLALMDAGVPIEYPVAGISIGMMSEGKDYVLLTDIIGLEDFSGDMDFKVAGTEKGVTAIQLDVKIPGLTIAQVGEILERAQKARMFILEKMLTVIPKERPELSEYAPKIEMIKIPVEKIGEVIGPGGRVIKNIIATTGATIDVEDDGSVTVSGTDDEAVKKAAEWVRSITREIVPGEVFEEGVVKRILPFGAFVEFLPGKEGMVHVSQMAQGFVKSPDEVVTIGQKVKVRVAEIDDQGRVNLSMKFGDANDTQPRSPQQPAAPSGRPMGTGTARPGWAEGRDRPRYSPAGNRNTAGPDRRGGRDDSGVSSDHPLTRQFRRERVGSRPPFKKR